MAAQIRRAAALARFEQRGAERIAVSVTQASVRGLGEQPGAGTLVDLSVFGCRLAVPSPFAKDARLWLRFDGGWPIAARVVWADMKQIGCRFDEPIANATMRKLVRG